ncbi:hypothetical protein MJG53_019390 [Ovis ammon polii x Ovis aries]|uniref:Uncharacterized protein n=2 Tax=Ovis TaxID=9935 RepID=A0A836CPW1_SHEEP|nr:hypothetical protein JEQ12_019585 [Ovis aries]KAI4554091.1 hypothetical protein MJG53_019390 [Ovis ammon polii x Ovis aries]
MLEAETPSFDCGSLRHRFPGNTMSQSQVHAAEKQAFRKRRQQLVRPPHPPLTQEVGKADSCPWRVSPQQHLLGDTGIRNTSRGR